MAIIRESGGGGQKLVKKTPAINPNTGWNRYRTQLAKAKGIQLKPPRQDRDEVAPEALLEEDFSSPAEKIRSEQYDLGISPAETLRAQEAARTSPFPVDANGRPLYSRSNPALEFLFSNLGRDRQLAELVTGPYGAQWGPGGGNAPQWGQAPVAAHEGGLFPIAEKPKPGMVDLWGNKPDSGPLARGLDPALGVTQRSFDAQASRYTAMAVSYYMTGSLFGPAVDKTLGMSGSNLYGNRSILPTYLTGHAGGVADQIADWLLYKQGGQGALGAASTYKKDASGNYVMGPDGRPVLERTMTPEQIVASRADQLQNVLGYSYDPVSGDWIKDDWSTSGGGGGYGGGGGGGGWSSPQRYGEGGQEWNWRIRIT